MSLPLRRQQYHLSRLCGEGAQNCGAVLLKDGFCLEHEQKMLSANNLQKQYGETVALKDFSIQVEAGEIVFLTGPSGCGKTTALRLLANLDVANCGTVQLGGKPSKEYGFAKWRALVTYVPQARVGLNGTPLALFRRVCAFKSRYSKHYGDANLIDHEYMEAGHDQVMSEEQFISVAESLGLASDNVTKQNWSELSGGTCLP